MGFATSHALIGIDDDTGTAADLGLRLVSKELFNPALIGIILVAIDPSPSGDVHDGRQHPFDGGHRCIAADIEFRLVGEGAIGILSR